MRSKFPYGLSLGVVKILTKKNFFISKKDPTWVILCGESIARIPESWKCLFDSESGIFCALKQKLRVFPTFDGNRWENHCFWDNFMRGIECTYSLKSENARLAGMRCIEKNIAFNHVIASFFQNCLQFRQKFAWSSRFSRQKQPRRDA